MAKKSVRFDEAMKKINFMKAACSIFVAILLMACNTTRTITPTAPKPTEWVTWEKPFIELGAIKKGEKRTFLYDFTNTTAGDVQVEIIDACDCTKVEFPRGAIKPGEKGRFDVVFDSTEKEGPETIEITIIWKNKDAAGNTRFDRVKYHYDLLK